MGEIQRRGEETTPEALLENEPAWQMIERLQKESKYERSDTHSANCTIECEGKKFRIEVIESREDPSLSEVQQIMLDTFGEEEVEDEEVMRSSIAGKTKWGTDDSLYRIVTMRDEQEKIVSIFTGSQLEMLDEEGEPNGESVYFVGYAATTPEAQQKGLAREAYISAMIDAAKQARTSGNTLKFAIGECTHTSEEYWNKVGWKRIYAQKGEEKKYVELKYIQAALDFDPETGKIADDAGEAPEHLMIDSFGRMPPNKVDIKKAYEALTYFCVDWPREAFTSDKAHKTQQKYLEKIKTKFNKSIDSATRFIFLDKENREKAKKQGVKITEHTAADKQETGEEDF